MTRPTPPALVLVDALVQLSFAVQSALGAVAAAHDLSVIGLRLLGILRDREPAMLDLARALNLEKSSITGLVDRAERRGLLERTRAEHDGRAVHVRLTPAGHTIAAALTTEVGRHITALTADLTKAERATLRGLAERIVADAR